MPPDSSKMLLSRLLLAVGVAGAASGCGARSEPPFDEPGGPIDVSSTGQGGSAGSSNNKAGAGGVAQGGTSQGGTSQGGTSQGGKAGTAQGGSAGAAAVCKNPGSPPKDSNGQYKCQGNGGFGLCDLRCYAPGPSTIPAPCPPADDPALLKLPNFEVQTCGLKKLDSGPYCNAEVEKIGGNSPICCYIAFSEPCAGRPLYMAGRPRLASLVRVAFG